MGASVAVAGAAIVHITKDIRNEAERRLHEEEKVSAEYGKQYSILFNIGKEVAKTRTEADKKRVFERDLASESLEQLESRKKTTQFLFDRTGDAERKKQYGQELAEEDAKIDEIKQKRKADFDKAYADNGENYRKSLEESAKYENDRIAKQNAVLEKRNADLKTATNKAEELGKKYRETFDNLFVSTTRDNPFAAIFSESDRAVDRLRENLKGLSPELQKIAEQLQKTSDSNKLFESRIDNSLDVFGLRDEAGKFRNPAKSPAQVEAEKRLEQERFKSNVEFNSAFAQNPAAYLDNENLANRKAYLEREDLTDKQRKQGEIELKNAQNQKELRDKDVDFFARYNQSGNINPQGSTFNDLNRQNFITGEARKLSAPEDDVNRTLQERLQKQIDIVDSKNAKTDDEKSIADRKLIALTSGLNSSQLTDKERDVAAGAREREATRREKYETDSLKLEREKLEVQKQIAASQAALLQLAQKEGLKGLDKLLVEIHDSPTTKSTVSRANPSDTAKQMDLSGTYFEQSRR